MSTLALMQTIGFSTALLIGAGALSIALYHHYKHRKQQ